MPSVTSLQLIITGSASSAVGALSSFRQAMTTATTSVTQQRQAIMQLQNEENKRAAGVRVQMATRDLQIRQEALALRNTPTALLAVEKAQERVRVAQFNNTIASDKLKFAQDQVAESGVKGFVGLNAAMVVAGATVGALITTYGKLESAISSAVEREVSVLGQEQTAIKTLGLNRDQARSYVEDFNRQVAILGRDLPTSSEKIAIFSRTIQDDYAIALKKAGASVDQIRAATLASSTRIALASEAANTDVGTTNAAIQAFLAGSVSSKAGLNQYQFFANNTQLRSSLEDQLKASGKQGFGTGDMSALQRIQILNKALQSAFTDDDIKELQGTAKAQIASFTDKLFDPETGLFSIERDLDPLLKGKQSVYTSFKSSIDLLIGDRGLFPTVGAFFQTDPMRIVRTTLDRANTFLGELDTSLSRMKTLDAGVVGGAVGKFAAQSVNIVTDGVLSALTKVDYGAILKGTVYGVGSFLANLDWKVYAVGSAALLGAAVAPALIGVVGAAAAVVGGAIVAALGGVPVIVAGAIVLGVVAVGKLIVDNWGNVTRTVEGWDKSLQRWSVETDKKIDAFVVSAGDRLGKWVNQTASVIDAGFAWIGNSFTAIFRTAADAVTGVINTVRDIIARVVNPIRATVGSLTSGAGSAVSNVQSTVSSSVSGVSSFFTGISSFLGGALSSVLPKYGGNIPAIAAANGLLSAITSEQTNKPPGSRLVIANDSEAILNSQMLSNLVGNVRSSNNNRTINISPGAIVINSANGDANQIADQVLTRLNQLFQTEIDTRLA